MSDATRQALILAAGRGSRLREHTANQPKCLLPLAGRPLLHWTLDALTRSGIERSAIVTGWQAAALEGLGSQRIHNPDWAHTGTARSLLCADAFLGQGTTLVVYGDGAYSSRVIGAVMRAPACDLLVPGDRHWQSLWQARFDDPLQDAESWRSEGARLIDIGARASDISTIGAQFMGLLRITAAGWWKLRACLHRWQDSDGADYLDRLDTTTMLARLLFETGPLPCLELDGGWVEIDTERDREVIETALTAGGFSHEFRS